MSDIKIVVKVICSKCFKELTVVGNGRAEEIYIVQVEPCKHCQQNIHKQHIEKICKCSPGMYNKQFAKIGFPYCPKCGGKLLGN